MKLLKAGTKVSFEGDSIVYEIAEYGMLIKKCDQNCAIDHDHYEEDYVRVNQITGTAFPLSQLKMVFDKNTGFGTVYNEFKA